MRKSALLLATLWLCACGGSKKNDVKEPAAEAESEKEMAEAKPEAEAPAEEAAPEPEPEEEKLPETLVTEDVEYTGGGVTMKGYLAYDSAVEGKRPAVLVVHEWWGLNEYAKKRARMLAALGYTALAVDMYGDRKQAETPELAQAAAGETMKDPKVTKARFEAAMKLLAAHETVDAKRVAGIGYCFGGTVVLNMARQGVKLSGVASFHGTLTPQIPAKRGKVKTKVLVLHGAVDPLVPPEQVDAFKQEMDKAKVDYRFIAYEGATHSFTSKEADMHAKKFNLPIAYNAEADQKSWEELQTFFGEIFGTAK